MHDEIPEETCPKVKPVRVIADSVDFYKCPQCEEKTRSQGKTYSHMGEKHRMNKLECRYCHFSTWNKTSMHNHKKLYCRENKVMSGGENAVQNMPIPKPVRKIIEGITYFGCSICEFTAKSGGKVHGHMVTDHGYKPIVCEYCKFSTSNSTSMHNHTRLYCRSLKK